MKKQMIKLMIEVETVRGNVYWLYHVCDSHKIQSLIWSTKNISFYF